jgi:hypothetical protein
MAIPDITMAKVVPLNTFQCPEAQPSGCRRRGNGRLVHVDVDVEVDSIEVCDLSAVPIVFGDSGVAEIDGVAKPRPEGMMPSRNRLRRRRSEVAQWPDSPAESTALPMSAAVSSRQSDGHSGENCDRQTSQLAHKDNVVVMAPTRYMICS